MSEVVIGRMMNPRSLLMKIGAGVLALQIAGILAARLLARARFRL